ncbi:MAG: hypothetical protein HY074_19535 [Deltaproteobacteria bacterium]|nr:hypothetical protein [Deltaproteobacteria bacterium]
MHKAIVSRFVSNVILSGLAILALSPAKAQAANGNMFWGFGPGIEVLSKDGTGTGFYIQGFLAHNFNSHAAIGGHAGYSNLGGVGIQAWDFGSFGQLTEPDSGLYGRFYLDGVNMRTSGGALAHGVNGTQTGLATGVGFGMLIPSVGSFHLVPELTYKVAFMQTAVNLVGMTFSAMWDF